MSAGQGEGKPQPGPRADVGETPSSGKNAAIPIWTRSQNFAPQRRLLKLNPGAVMNCLIFNGTQKENSDGRKGSIERV